jgi:hypothetical protein
MEKIEGHC